MSIHYDIAIIGLGPAGSTLARLLDASFSVIALDKKGNGFEKPCGGLLAPDAQKSLAKFGLTLPKSVLTDPQIFAVKTMDFSQNLLRYYQRFYINLDRNRFDQWLISLIPPKTEIKSRAVCTDIIRDTDGFTIKYSHNGENFIIKADKIIGADGAGSIVRSKLFPNKKIRHYTAVQQWFNLKSKVPFYISVFDKRLTDAYCWAVAKDGFMIAGGAFDPKNSRIKFNEYINYLSQKGIIQDKSIKTEACHVCRPSGYKNFCTGKDNAFLIGEAAGFISPSSFEGISYALDSAFMLAEILNAKKVNPNALYKAKTAKIRRKLILKHLKSPFLYNAFLRKVVMKSGISSIKYKNNPTK